MADFVNWPYLTDTAGLYVLASEPVKIPWFDAIFADIGDEQSLSQSLSTFSGHLKQIGVGLFCLLLIHILGSFVLYQTTMFIYFTLPCIILETWKSNNL